ncbi:hypothetical protein UCRPA7_6361 [Phaeoacremonium minimum UCRPA7]|uniref:Uncharacterized protein n=1 Tax=Phaeoacremonium minimum (strain UCR-PA7) TaxID=1286976 RepID=R8BFM4_PHAM7|nr:hypothetical protein UCRPA7_6361 [Phaeoacremonium minimum UCRPA7]EON98089.1 hypothetical protein UCRPA7_6361 [Phaeoacremonium minimum UCRPA7]
MKNEASYSDAEVESHDLHLQAKTRTLRLLDGARISVTTLALLCGITVLGVSGDALNVYNTTSVSHDFPLSLWPDEFNIRPTVALVVGSSIVTVTNIVALLCSKVRYLRHNTPVHTPVMFAAPLVGLVAALIAMVFFYAVNASNTVDTLLSWTCRWHMVSMDLKPHFGTLCKESRAGVYLSILLIPIEAIALGLAGWELKVEKFTSAYARARKGSPVA